MVTLVTKFVIEENTFDCLTLSHAPYTRRLIKDFAHFFFSPPTPTYDALSTQAYCEVLKPIEYVASSQSLISVALLPVRPASHLGLKIMAAS